MNYLRDNDKNAANRLEITQSLRDTRQLWM